MFRSSHSLVACVLLCGCGTDEPSPPADDSTGSPTADSTGLSMPSTGGQDSTGDGSEGSTGDTAGGTTDGTSISGSGSTDSGSTDSGSTGSDSGSSDSGSSDSSDSGSSDTGSDLSCVDLDAGSALGFLVNQSVVGLGDDFDHPCSAISGEDLIMSWTAPYTGVFTFVELVPEATIAVIEGDCDGLILGCNEALWAFGGGGGDFSTVFLALDEGDDVLIVATTEMEPFFVTVEVTGNELTPDESCIDEDLGSVTGPAAGTGADPTIFSWTAPATATYTFSTPSGPDEINIFRPGCASLSPRLIDGSSLTGPVPNPPSAFHALDLVAGQAIAIEVGNVGQPFELDITQNGTPGGTCCSPRHGAGCNVPAIEASVCANDAYCCDTRWDFNCSGAAKFAYDANCIGG